MTGSALNILDMNGLRISNVGDPVNDNDAVNKLYLRPLLEGTKWKNEGIRVRAQGNINITSPGATIDSITLNQNDRVLLSSQIASEENGIYVFDSPTTPLVRSLDGNTFEELIGARVVVVEGTNKNTTYQQTESGAGVIDVDPNLWIPSGVATPDATEVTKGKVRYATSAEAIAGTEPDAVITPATLSTVLSSNVVQKAVTNVGNNVDTTFTITHNLGTLDICYQAFYNGTNKPVLWVEVTPTTPSTAILTTAAGYVLGTDEIRLVIIG